MANTANAGMQRQNQFTTDDVIRRAQELGVWANLSDADRNAVYSHPDIGMTIIEGRANYRDSTSPEQRALIHAKVEAARQDLGYSGGSNGNIYSATPRSPDDFGYDMAPSFADTYGGRYDAQLDRVLNYGEFGYDPETDPLYQGYRKQYTREGQRASEDVMAQAAAMSGGLPSSAAATAAAQQANYYRSQMTDKIPELYQIAYNKYLNDFDLQRNKLNAVGGARDAEFNRYETQLGQYNTDRGFAYQQHLDEIADQQARWNMQMQRALNAAEYGDYAPLREVGIDASNYRNLAAEAQDLDAQYRQIQTALAVGDTATLRRLGYDTGYLDAQQQANLAALNAAQAGRAAQYTGGGPGDVGQNTPANEASVNPNNRYSEGNRLLSEQSKGAAVEDEVKRMRRNGKTYEEINTYIDQQLQRGTLTRAEALTLRSVYGVSSL